MSLGAIFQGTPESLEMSIVDNLMSEILGQSKIMCSVSYMNKLVEIVVNPKSP